MATAATAVGTWLSIVWVLDPATLVPTGATLLPPPTDVLSGPLLLAAIGIALAWIAAVIATRSHQGHRSGS